jgi:hypothetical protein
VGGAVTHQHVKLLSGVVPGYPASTFLQEPSASKTARESLYSQPNFPGRPFGSGPFARTTIDLSGKPSAQKSSGPDRLTREMIHRTRCWITDMPITCRHRRLKVLREDTASSPDCTRDSRGSSATGPEARSQLDKRPVWFRGWLYGVSRGERGRPTPVRPSRSLAPA